MTNPAFGESLRQRIYDNRTFDDYKYYGDFYSSTNTGGTSQLIRYFPGRRCGRRHQLDKPLVVMNYLWFKPNFIGSRSRTQAPSSVTSRLHSYRQRLPHAPQHPSRTEEAWAQD
ncbi:hypothetical protein OS493_001763 [Desmophyllum pertusum]|uniref:Uncharacterized protein n=1 Tax=Desmophyllum pertusum TaxID=174260 RepID=A0A9W9Z443_9CNID|nr:hypothetical protein OS493_001763 [Desmophyllum pertusum]